MNIVFIGAGYVGGPTITVMASKCPEIQFTCVDINQDRINAWNSKELPIYEPGLDDLVKKNRNKNLFFSTNVEEAVKNGDIIFVSVNTPTKTFGKGAGYAANLEYWEKTARMILDVSTSNKIIVEKSTLPVKTADAMARILNSDKAKYHFDILSNPEFLAEGTAINDLLHPDRVLIGSFENENGIKARQKLVELYQNWVPKEKILTTNIWSSELSKLTANAFLAQRISSINAISALCEETDANIEEVSKAIGMDTRIGNKFLKASVGFGGSCFKKDILNLAYLSRHYGLTEVADYWESVVNINEYQKERLVDRMLNNMFRTLSGKKICILGFAFKANTSDTRESPAISITKKLLEERAEISISDPKAIENAKKDLADLEGKISFTEDPYEASKGAHSLLILTEWDIYKDLDYQKIYDHMEKPAFLFDGRSIIDRQKCYDIGFNVFTIGTSSLKHFD
ncbi:MAG: UDP-glucose 6-dehydrogenase [Planctomycetota bacterium]|nr:MAG: UDP-glucose 6-dehydrogenase [Planctomycetota bacterium]